MFSAFGTVETQVVQHVLESGEATSGPGYPQRVGYHSIVTASFVVDYSLEQL